VGSRGRGTSAQGRGFRAQSALGVLLTGCAKGGERVLERSQGVDGLKVSVVSRCRWSQVVGGLKVFRLECEIRFWRFGGLAVWR